MEGGQTPLDILSAYLALCLGLSLATLRIAFKIATSGDGFDF